MKKLLLFFLTFSSFQNYAQAPAIAWQKSLGGSVTDIAQSIVKTADGGSIQVGRSNSNDGDVFGNHGNIDCWVVKLNALGGIQWQHCYGGTGNDLGCSIQQTSDFGYIICGSTDSNDGDISGNHAGSTDVLVLKIDSLGAIQWQKSLGGTGTETAFSIKQNTDGTYILAGYTNSNDGDVSGNHGADDGWVAKLNPLGTIMWQHSYGGTFPDNLYSVEPCADLGYIIAGFSASTNGDITATHGGAECWLIKTDSLGTISWQHCYGGTANDYAINVHQTADLGFVSAGYSNSTNGDVTGNHASSDDIWIVKTDVLGNLSWQKSIGGTGTDQGIGVAETSPGNYIVAGLGASNNGDITGSEGSYDYILCLINWSGSIQWLTSVGGTSSDYAHSFFYDPSNISCTVAGNSYSNDVDVSGNHAGSSDSWIVHFDNVLGVTEFQNENSIVISPNPSNGKFTFSSKEEINQIQIFDVTGKLIYKAQTNVTLSRVEVSIDLLKKGKGIYFYTVENSKKEIQKGKLIIN